MFVPSVSSIFFGGGGGGTSM